MNRLVIALAGAALVSVVFATDNLPQAPDNPVMSEAAAKAAQVPLAVSPEIAAALESVNQYTGSAAFQAAQDQAWVDIMALLGVADPHTGESGQRAPKKHPHRAVMFISSSIPVATLRNYAADLEKVDGVMVLRGLVDGMKRMGPTAHFIAPVLRVDPQCQGPDCIMRKTQVIVDPLLFRANGVTQVPAFAFQPNMALETYCAREAGEAIPTSRAVVYGDAALSGLIEEYARLTKDPRVTILLEELDNG